MPSGLFFITLVFLLATRGAALSLAQAKTNFLVRADSQPQEANAALDLLIDHPKATRLPTRLPDNLGQWRVNFAPHIRALSAILLTDFDVYYNFSTDNKLLSSVRYSSKIFGSGHLSTSGSYSMTQQVCKIKWTRIWWDVSDSPTPESAVEKHLLPGLIQAIGSAAFVEGVSFFPVEYFDRDLCVFLFKLTGTRICARKME